MVFGIIGCTKEIPVPEGSVLACDGTTIDGVPQCHVYNLGLICSDKETNNRQQQELFDYQWLLLNTEDQKIYTFGTGFDSHGGGKKIGNIWGFGRRDLLTTPEYYEYERIKHIKQTVRLYRDTLRLDNPRWGYAPSMICKLSSPEQVKLEIDSQKEFFLKKGKLKQEEQRLKDAEQLKDNKI